MDNKSNHSLVKERIELAKVIVELLIQIVLLATAIFGLFNVAFNYSKYSQCNFQNV